MYKRVKIKKLGRTRSNRKALVQNQVRSLFSTGKVQTTTAKAKVLFGEAQSLLKRMASAGDLNSTKLVSRILSNRDLAQNAITYAKGGNAVVKIMKVGFRDGDNAQVSRVELVGYTLPTRKVSKKTQKKGKETKEVKSDAKKINVAAKKQSQARSAGKKVTGTVTARRQRATSRSGL